MFKFHICGLCRDNNHLLMLILLKLESQRPHSSHPTICSRNRQKSIQKQAKNGKATRKVCNKPQTACMQAHKRQRQRKRQCNKQDHMTHKALSPWTAPLSLSFCKSLAWQLHESFSQAANLHTKAFDPGQVEQLRHTQSNFPFFFHFGFGQCFGQVYHISAIAVQKKTTAAWHFDWYI